MEAKEKLFLGSTPTWGKNGRKPEQAQKLR
jgi:hypothetical protein